MKYNKQCY